MNVKHFLYMLIVMVVAQLSWRLALNFEWIKIVIEIDFEDSH